MKKLLLVFAIGAFSVSCGPSLCDCVEEQASGEMSDACTEMQNEMKNLKGDELKAKMDEVAACGK